MPVTPKTFSLVGDLKFATPKIRSHAILSFAPAIAVSEKACIMDVVPTGTNDLAIVLGGLTTVKWMVIMLDDELDGWIEVKFNGQTTGVPVGSDGESGGMYVAMPTTIVSMTVSNNSGNDAGVTIHMGGE